jgi:hypothetical protein
MGVPLAMLGSALLPVSAFGLGLPRPNAASGGSGQHRAPAGLFPPIGRDQASVLPNAKTKTKNATVNLVLTFKHSNAQTI